MTPPSETYLKTQQVAQALGVSVSTIKRWVDSGMLHATRTVGKHRLIPRQEAIRFALEQGFGHVFDIAGLQSAPHLLIDDHLVERLTCILRRGRNREARDLILDAYTSAGPLVLADDLIRPAMQRLGHDWENSTLDVYQEHRATRVVTHALMEIIQGQQLQYISPDAPLALGAAPEGDPYILPGLLCEMVLRELGWDVMNLGVNLPMASLTRAVQAHRPALAWVSVSYVTDPTRFLEDYAAFQAVASASPTAVVVGGQALVPDLRARMVAASFGDRMSHLAEFARRLRPDAVAPRNRLFPNQPT